MKNVMLKRDCFIGLAAGMVFAGFAMATMSLFCAALSTEKLDAVLAILQTGAFAAVIFAALFALPNIKSLLIRAAAIVVSAVLWFVFTSVTGAMPKFMNLFDIEVASDNNAAGLVFILLCIGCLIAYAASAAVSLILRHILCRKKAGI